MFIGPGILVRAPLVSTYEGGYAAEAAAAATQARTDVEALERRVERLALVSEALWELLHERVGITEEQLLERVHALDLADGYEDGRVRRSATPCPACRRVVGIRHKRCIYCSADLGRPPFAG